MCVTVIGVTGRLAIVQPCGRRERDDRADPAPPAADDVIVLAGVPLPFGMVAAVPASACVLGGPAPRGKRARKRWRWSPARGSAHPGALAARA